MSAICVTLVLKTNIYKSKLFVIQHFASLDIEHSKLNTRHYRRTLIRFCANLNKKAKPFKPGTSLSEKTIP